MKEKQQKTLININIKKILVSICCDANINGSIDFDLTSFAFMLNSNGKCIKDDYVVFYGNRRKENDVLYQFGSALEEQYIIDLKKIPKEIDKIAICFSLYDAIIRKQNMNYINNKHICILDAENNFNKKELFYYSFDKDNLDSTAVVVCEIYRQDNIWVINTICKGYSDIFDVFEFYGINLK